LLKKSSEDGGSGLLWQLKIWPGNAAPRLEGGSVYDQILSVPDSNFLEDLDLNAVAIE
jgi:hypothetical protein